MTSARLVPKAFWIDDQPLVWFKDEGPLPKKGRYCVMKGDFVFARYNRRPDAELVIRRILSALSPETMLIPGSVPKRSGA